MGHLPKHKKTQSNKYTERMVALQSLVCGDRRADRSGIDSQRSAEPSEDIEKCQYTYLQCMHLVCRVPAQCGKCKLSCGCGMFVTHYLLEEWCGGGFHLDILGNGGRSPWAQKA